MSLLTPYNLTKRLIILLCLLAWIVGLGLSQPPATRAQTADETYNCGTYGGGDYGSNECAGAGEITPSPTPTPATSGQVPETGASLGRWAGVGTLLLAIGMGLYGYARRRARRTS